MQIVVLGNLSGLFCARDGSGNPLRNKVAQRLKSTARPEVFMEGHALKQIQGKPKKYKNRI